MDRDIDFLVDPAGCLLVQAHQIAGLHAGIAGAELTAFRFRGGLLFCISRSIGRKDSRRFPQTIRTQTKLRPFRFLRLIHQAGLQPALHRVRCCKAIRQRFHRAAPPQLAAPEDTVTIRSEGSFRMIAPAEAASIPAGRNINRVKIRQFVQRCNLCVQT